MNDNLVFLKNKRLKIIFILRNVNECFKGIDLGTIFRNIFYEKNDKTINFSDIFLYFS